MKDFRDKITSYKAEPSDAAFEKMQIKRQKAKLTKFKYGLLAMIGLNVLGFVWLVFNMYNQAATFPINELSVIEQTIEEPTRADPSDLYSTEEIAALTTINDSLGITTASLRQRISQLTSTLNTQSELLSYYKNASEASIVSNVSRQESNNYNASNYINARKNERTSQVDYIASNVNIKKYETDSKRISLLPKLSSSNIKLEHSLFNLASTSNIPIVANLLPQVILDNNLFTNWYVTIGVRVQNLVIDRQRNFHIGLNRELTKRFDVGLLFDFGQIRERNNFLLNNEVKDFRLNAFGIALLRYKFLNKKRLNVYVDGGIGYRYGVISFRQSQVIDNELVYFNDAQQFDALLFQIALGATYDVTTRFSFGTRFYVDSNLHSSFDLNYRF